MNNVARIIKYVAIAFALFLIYSIFKFGFMFIGYFVDGFSVNMDVDKKIVELEKDKNNYILEVLIGAADVEIIEGDEYNVASDNKYVEVIQEGNLLKVVETKHRFSLKNKNKIIITIPKNIKYDGIAINGGTGKIKICDLVTKNISINTGVGDFYINSLTSSDYTKIDSGVGRFTIDGGSLKDANIEFGVGEVNIKSNLLGKSHIESGIGKNNIVILGKQSDYTLDIEKGIGSINVNGRNASNGIIGIGDNKVEISGGIGEINIDFE